MLGRTSVSVAIRSMLLAFLGGCAIRAPTPVVTANGYQGPLSPAVQSTFYLFKQAFDASACASALRPKAGPETPPSANGPCPTAPGTAETSEADLANRMLRIGGNLEFQLCSEFFANGGQEQQHLLFAKDLLTLIGTITSGVLGATRSSPAAVAWVGLGSATAISGINAYQRNFLFSEDNIQAVQTLTLNALDVARNGATASDFAEGVSKLMQVQAVCQPQKILALVRDAIKTGKPELTGTAEDFRIFKEIELGKMVNGGVALNDQQLQGLYWYFLGTTKTPAASAGGKLDAIKTTLLSLAISPIDSAGKPNSSFPAAGVAASLRAMSPELSSVIAANINAAASDAPNQPTAEARSLRPDARRAVVPAVLPNLPATLRGGRIDVQIR